MKQLVELADALGASSQYAYELDVHGIMQFRPLVEEEEAGSIRVRILWSPCRDDQMHVIRCMWQVLGRMHCATVVKDTQWWEERHRRNAVLLESDEHVKMIDVWRRRQLPE